MHAVPPSVVGTSHSESDDSVLSLSHVPPSAMHSSFVEALGPRWGDGKDAGESCHEAQEVTKSMISAEPSFLMRPNA